ncbi:MAG: molybdopterin molybdenumtransferase MoeA [Methanobacteriaceae archaeon]|jgi:molybdopterin molybdotransferase|nr:molybdopterin molybdenumtransferase MoeA [Methanobacteriaceae archaeon]
MGTEFLKIKEYSEAKDIINDLFDKYYTPLNEEVYVKDSYSRILFQDVYSLMDYPSFNKALKDGFAIKSEDSYGANEENPNTLKIIDFLEAGFISEKSVEKGKCIEISTGAPIPDGADSVAMVEYTNKHGDEVDILKSITPFNEIAKKGSDMKESNLLLKKKDFLNPGKIGVLLSQGFEKVEVFKKPIVGVISTGNEIISQNDELSYGKIYDVNCEMIKNSIISFGAIGKSFGIVKDDYDSLKLKIQNSLKEVDILICSGGTSAGLGDVLKQVLDELGEVHIHGISVQPGKPTIVAEVNNKIVIGLPGNPVSAIVIFNVFIAPQIAKLLGFNLNLSKKTIKAKLSKKIHSSVGRLQYQLVKFRDGFVEPIFKDSGAIFSLSEADGYVKVLKSVELVDEKEEVEVYLFD